jgi:alpha-beta hydrolase superfamily lysophospholipase
VSVATPVTFSNRAGHRLFGVLHTPPGYSRGDLTVLLLSPGVKMRVGPQRLYLHVTEALLKMGLAVFRFDFHGLGDSEGMLPEAMLRDFYNHIEVGRYVEDTIDAMDWMQKEHGCSRFVVSGLCGGAITGLLTGNRDSRVVGLLGLGITPVLAARSAEASRYMTIGQLEAAQKMYLRRLLNPKAWFRLLTFKADYRLIFRMLKHWMQRTPAAKPAPPPAAAAEYDNANPLFPPAFFKMLSTRRPMLLVFGGSDRLHYEYQEKFLARHSEQLKSLPELAEVHVIASANHVLSFTEWQRELLDVSERWLKTNFSKDVTSSARA